VVLKPEGEKGGHNRETARYRLKHNQHNRGDSKKGRQWRRFLKRARNDKGEMHRRGQRAPKSPHCGGGNKAYSDVTSL